MAIAAPLSGRFSIGCSDFPGVARKARNVLLFALIMIFIKAGGGAWSGSVLWPGTAMEFELNLRTMSLIVLAFTTALEALARMEHDRLSRNGLAQARAFLDKAMRP
jgi:hypothetical protein